MEEENKIENKSILNLSSTEIKIFLGVGILLVLIPLIFTCTDISWISFKETGTIGDTIGGITAPFIGFGGSILVYLALKAQIDANNAIQEQFNEQKKVDYRQNFENTFFNMLTIHHDIIKNIDYNLKDLVDLMSILHKYSSKNNIKEIYSIVDIDKPVVSRDVFKVTLNILKRLIKEDLVIEHQLNRPNGNNILMNAYDDSLKNKLNDFEKIFSKSQITFLNITEETRFQSIYDSIYFKLSTDFGHYFRNVYRIIKMVDEKKFSNDIIDDFKIKYSYTSIVRAQLSDDEIVWLFFNCLSDKGSEKFKPLLEKYSFLKILNLEDTTYAFYTKFYEDSAFEKPKEDDLEVHIKKFK